MALILIVDDDKLVIDMVQATLGARGHIVGAVGGGAPVLGAVEFRHPALVIIDCSISVLSGVEALRQIRRSRIWHTIPVMMLTGWCGEVDEEIATRSGADDCLRKPLAPSELVSRAEALLRGTEAQKQPLRSKSAPLRRWGQQ